MSLPSGPERTALSRRQLLAGGTLSLLGLSLADLLRAEALTKASATKPRSSSFGKAKSCIIVFLKGGPSHHDTFDMKPDAPKEIRGEFKPIPTNVSGMHVCEHLPRLSKIADKYAVMRAVHLVRNATHGQAAYEMTTGFRWPRRGDAVMTREDHPNFGSVVSATSSEDLVTPPFVMAPEYIYAFGDFRGGQNAGRLGAGHDPFVPWADPSDPKFQATDLGLAPRVETPRLRSRANLLSLLDTQFRAIDHVADAAAFDTFQQKAMSILTTREMQQAFDVGAESKENRDRYGRSQLGQTILLGRRLVEAGVRLVHVNDMINQRNFRLSWDSHWSNFDVLKNHLLPSLDPGVASLLEDMSSSGLLDETLVVVMGEFGRTPKINKEAGRDHWPSCFSVFMAGAGIAGGRYLGASDKNGAYPVDRPVSSGDVAATIFHALGIDPRLELGSFDGQPYTICEGDPVLDLWG